MYEELRLSEPIFVFLGFVPCFAINAHLTLSGLQSGCHWKMIAAHRHLPCGTRLRVTNKRNGKKVTVTVSDRGPYGDTSIKLDVSRRAARRLGFIHRGITRIRARVLSN